MNPLPGNRSRVPGGLSLGAILLLLALGGRGPSETARAEEENGKNGEDTPPKSTNHLAGETSPYLLQHADNPVNWYPWGEEAFAKARETNQPIFLSVGYSTCHWCHVMERESFSDPEVAAYMNEHFVNIKVDREERPDVDRVYMTYVQAATGGGGWPMSVWLTPDLKPFQGGTYFPPEDRRGRPGFMTVLEAVAEAWEKREDEIRKNAGNITDQLRQITGGGGGGEGGLDAAVLDAGFEEMAGKFDAEEGGFGPAPKFPRPSELWFLFAEADRAGLASERGKKAVEMATFTLERMAAGGIHDQLGGGFHRYSVDGRWHVPHFEKMLYDQAQLAEAYLIAHQITGGAIFADTARDILDYVLRVMTSPEGGFYSAEDADSYVEKGGEKAEGAFYVWTRREIREVLGEERAAEFEFVHGVKKGGNAKPDGDPHGELDGKNVLHLVHGIEEAAEKFDTEVEDMRRRIEGSRRRLLQARQERPRPAKDDKVITAWNGLMISALARGHRVLGEERYLEAARSAAGFARSHLHDAEEGTLRRLWREGPSDIDGFVSDYAFLVRGLIDLYLSDFDTGHLEWALALHEKQNALFRNEESGGYFSSTGEDSSLILQLEERNDGAVPSPNSITAMNQLRLAHLLGDPDFSTGARETLQSLAGSMKRAPLSLPMGLTALERHFSPGEQIVLVGNRDEPTTRKMLRATWDPFLPGAVWALVEGEDSRSFFARRAEFYETVKQKEDRPTAYVCRDFVCQLPTADLDTLTSQLEGLGEGERTSPSQAPRE